jgi:hypothetical protein
LNVPTVGNFGAGHRTAGGSGVYDKTNLPPELILSNYFTVRDGQITTLTIIFNQPSPY